MVINGVNFPEDRISDFCRRHGVTRLSLYGSILRDDFNTDSDVDMLAEFEPGRTPGMFGFGGMILELSEMIGRRVDLRTPFDLSRHFRPFVLRGARLLQPRDSRRPHRCTPEAAYHGTIATIELAGWINATWREVLHDGQPYCIA